MPDSCGAHPGASLKTGRALQRHATSDALPVLAGALCCASGRHVLSSLTWLPGWFGWLLAAALVAGIWRRCHQTRLLLCLSAGAVCASALPSSVPAPGQAIVARVPFTLRGADLFDVLQRLDDEPAALIGRCISVTGLWRHAQSTALAAVYRPVMTCCAADAVNVGLDVMPNRPARVKDGAWVLVRGWLEVQRHNGETRYRLERAFVQSSRAKVNRSCGASARNNAAL